MSTTRLRCSAAAAAVATSCLPSPAQLVSMPPAGTEGLVERLVDGAARLLQRTGRRDGVLQLLRDIVDRGAGLFCGAFLLVTCRDDQQRQGDEEQSEELMQMSL